MPRDRAGSFGPQVVKKHQSELTELKRKVLLLYALYALCTLGNSYQEIQINIAVFMECHAPLPPSNATLNAVTDKLPAEIQA